MIVKPVFYERFSCKAGACAHSCCKGWEIDVDAGSAALYRQLPGELGEKLRKNLCQDNEGFHFALTEVGRCPFLQPDGLCELICREGEDLLCDICALHPRFFEEIGEHELWGLGLSCEAVCKLLKNQTGPLLFLADNREAPLDLPHLTALLGLDYPRALCRYEPELSESRITGLLEKLKRTEAIDDLWPRELEDLAHAGRELISRAMALYRSGPLPWERLYQYLLYRQLERQETPERLAAYAALSTDFILLQTALRGEDYTRRFSEQIEYSTENVELLLQGNKHPPV